MARPLIDGLFDHTVRIWRPTASSDNRLGVERRRYTAILSNVGCALNRSTAPVQDIGPGMHPIGARRFYFRPDLDIRIRDVIEIMTGPEAVQTWEVDQPPTRPRGHHTQVDAIVWSGTSAQLGAVMKGSASFIAPSSMSAAGTIVNPEIQEPLEGTIDMTFRSSMIGGGTARPVATGGVITEVGGFRIHTFLASGNFVVAGSALHDVEYLIVAGGGAGSPGSPYGGGGGGGGLRKFVGQAIGIGVFPVVVGNGGIASVTDAQRDGQASSFNGSTSTGGGGGGHNASGRVGGSGGGAPSNTGNGGAGVAGQGFAGGARASNNGGGGGGGAGGLGGSGGGAGVAGVGGVGLNDSISGAAVMYAAGGGASGVTGGTASTGGGRGAQNNIPFLHSVAGTDGRGGGGGAGINGSADAIGKKGGTGVVIIRYPIPQ